MTTFQKDLQILADQLKDQAGGDILLAIGILTLIKDQWEWELLGKVMEDGKKRNEDG
jgi:hypothetical protein